MSITSELANGGIAMFVAYEVVLRRRDPDTSTWKGDDADRGSTRLILGAYLLAVLIDVGCAASSIAEVPHPARWIGIAAIVAGLLLRAWAMTTLGRYYTRTLRTAEDQRVVDSGPYRLIRHPGYTASTLIWTGYGLALGSWFATLLTVVLLGAVYHWRIAAEERVLRGAFGADYVSYERRTKRLIPYVY